MVSRAFPFCNRAMKATQCHSELPLCALTPEMLTVQKPPSTVSWDSGSATRTSAVHHPWPALGPDKQLCFKQLCLRPLPRCLVGLIQPRVTTIAVQREYTSCLR